MKLFLLSLVLFCTEFSFAQNYKLSQSTSMMGMKSTTTIYVKGSRKRTEAGPVMGFGGSTVTIEQCDKQRTIKLNDKKKLYFIEPFANPKDMEEVIDEDAPVKKPTAKPVANPQKGGTITLYYSITDTGERKKMYGFTARHVWTFQKIKPSADACTMKDSIIIKTDGWYIDLPEFNCPVHYRPAARMGKPGEMPKPDCQDHFVVRRKGKGKLGFPLTETTTIIMGGNQQMGEISTGVETVSLSTEKLDSMLFEIPPGYTETQNEEDLQDKMDVKDMMKNIKDHAGDLNKVLPPQAKQPGAIRIGVYAPTGAENIEAATRQLEMAAALHGDKVDAVAVANEAEARSKQCDYVLSTDITKMKSGSKVGGLLKAIKNTDPNAASSFTIDATFTLTSLGDGSVRTTQSVSGKYDGKPDAAAQQALNEGCGKVMKALK